MTITNTITVLNTRLLEAVDHLNKIVAKAEKYQADSVSYVIGKPYQDSRSWVDYTGKRHKSEFTFHDIEITGKTPVIGKHVFQARIEHLATGNIIDGSRVETVGIDWRTVESHCDHCGHDRNRNYTYLIQDTESGKQYQIGSTCLKAYLGDNDVNPAHIGAMFDVYSHLEALGAGEREESLSWGSCGVSTFNTIELIMVSLATIRTFGYNKADSLEKTPTSQTVLDILNPISSNKYRIEERKQVMANALESDFDLAQTIIQWAIDGKAGDSDYAHNLKILAGFDYTEGKRLGLMVSLPRSYQLAMDRESKAKANAKTESGEFVGQVGDKLKDLELTQIFNRVVGQNQFGVSVLIKYKDSAGNIFCWFTGEGKARANGDSVILSGTIKAHNEFKGSKETQLTRCRIK